MDRGNETRNIYDLVLPFEQNFDIGPTTVWMQANWQHSLTLSVLYVLAIFGGRRLMAGRPAFVLDRWLTRWNVLLAVFSVVGALRMTPEFFHILSQHGFRRSVCTAEYALLWVPAFWTVLFTFSKALELIDTAFIVLRKRPLMFLHWYHHVTVLIYTWHAYKDQTAGGRWFVTMNYYVHAFMYSYYALRSAGLRFPKWIPMSITVMQLAQMILGCSVAVEAYRAKRSGTFCQQTDENLYFSFAIYFSYFLLFARLFYDSYVKRGNRYDCRVKSVRDDHHQQLDEHHLDEHHLDEHHQSRNGKTVKIQ